MSRAKTAIRRATVILSILAATLSLSACGGGVGPVAGGGIGGTGLTAGSITAFGSVVVNGVTFQTTPGTIRQRLDDDVPGNVPGLDNEVFKVGMMVRVHHGADDNNATEIDFQDDLEGPVADLDNAAGTFSVLGQPVAFDNATNLFLEPLAAFDNGATVEVSGLYDNAGVLRASFIKVEAVAKTLFDIKGFVTNLDIAQTTFSLGPTPAAGTIPVNYGSAQLKDLPAGLANGTFVEVKTTSSAGTLIADSVEGKRTVADDAPAGGKGSVEGFVANLAGTSPNFTFFLNGMTVATDSATAGLANVRPNAHVQAEGVVQNGILSARTITPR